MVSDTIQWGNNTVRLTWLPAKTKPTDFPYTQSYGIVFNENGEILIINNEHWTLPGGTPEVGETAKETLKRELMEETGIKLNSTKVIAINNDMVENAHFVTIGLLCEDFEGEPKVMEPEEITEWKWFDLNNLPKPMFFPCVKIINNFLEGKFYKY